MSTIYLTHTALVIDTCETAWTSNQGGNVTCSADTTYFKVGEKSAKMAMGVGATADLLAYRDFSSANYSTYTHLVGWIRASSNVTASQLQILLDNTSACASPLETLNVPALTANTWYRFCLVFSTPANLTAVVSIGLKQVSDLGAIDVYLDDIRVVKCLSISTPVSVKGIVDPQRAELKVIQNEYLDGSRDEQQIGFIRHPFVDIGTLQTKADRVSLFDFFRAEDKCLIYEGEEVSVVNDDSSVFESIWLFETELCPSFQLSFREKTMLTSSPASWS